jgi:rsbT co-antagonist protein RsbR
VPVVGNLDSYRARSLTIALLTGIKEQQARVLVLDITGVSTVDSSVANHLMQTVTAARLMGAHSIVTGISPSVAEALVKIGVNIAWLNTFGDLQRGIEEAERLLK